MIELRGLSKSYLSGDVETPVLRGITAVIEEGEFVALMGPSGTGKSTLLNILGGLDRATDGTYLLAGQDLTALDDDRLSAIRNRRIGFVFQLFHLLPRLTVLQNVLLPYLYTDPYPPDARERAERMLDLVGLSDRMHFRPNQLSGGQQQRVAIARALINEPVLLLADEPTGNLDSKASREIMEIFDRIHRQGRTLVMVTHEEEIAAHASRVLHMRDGRIAEDFRQERV